MHRRMGQRVAKGDRVIEVSPEAIQKLLNAGTKAQLCAKPELAKIDSRAKDHAIRVPSKVLASIYAAKVATFTMVPEVNVRDCEPCLSLPVCISKSVLKASRKSLGFPVTLHVYDVYWFTAKVRMPTFHLGVEVLGSEFAFGDLGVYCNDPGDYYPDLYRTCKPLGYTRLQDHEIFRLLRQLEIEWPGEAYRLNGHNCQTFASTFCDRLGLPDTIPQECLFFSEPWAVLPWQLWSGRSTGIKRSPGSIISTKLSL